MKIFLRLSLLAFTATILPAYAAEDELTKISLPPGFVIETLPFSVPNARQMALTDLGMLIVGTRRAGKVYAIPNALSTEVGEPVVVARDLTMPSGVAVLDGDLYIAATHEVLKIASIDENFRTPQFTTITDNLPKKRHHGWKYIKFGPDGNLFVPVGAPCNICLSKDPRFASLLTLNLESGASAVWAEGLRNTVGFAWHPVTGDLWISDNGRDQLGDDIPAEEINIADAAGHHFGYPFVHAGDINDPKFGDHDARGDKQFSPPALKIQAHSAALGMDFYTHDAFPPEYANALFVAEHGSWNRSNKVGYRVSVITEQNGQLTYAPFAQGWLQGEKNWGRPNDVLVIPDGSLLVSDDQRGVIYRISHP